MYPLLYSWKKFYEYFLVKISAAFNTFEWFEILALDFPLSVTSVFSVVLYFICWVIYGLINSIIEEHLSQTENSCEARRLDKFALSEYKNIMFYYVFAKATV